MPGARAQSETFLQRWREKLSCSSDECGSLASPWRRISRSRASILLHGARYCFPACFERELLRQVRVWSGTESTLARTGPRRIPLGLLMLSRGDLDPFQLRQALEKQRRHQAGRIGEWIQKLGFADERQITAALAAQFACPVLHNVPSRPVEGAGVPLTLCTRFSMVPVHHVRSSNTLYMAFAGAVQYRVLLAVEQLLGCRTQPCMVSGSALQMLLSQAEEQPSDSDVWFGSVRDRTELVRICSGYTDRTGADRVELAVCGEHLWIRISGAKGAVNLVFA